MRPLGTVRCALTHLFCPGRAFISSSASGSSLDGPQVETDTAALIIFLPAINMHMKAGEEEEEEEEKEYRRCGNPFENNILLAINIHTDE